MSPQVKEILRSHFELDERERMVEKRRARESSGTPL
jgi:hypothetical protein